MYDASVKFVVKSTQELVLSFEENVCDWLPTKMDTFNYRGVVFLVIDNHFDYDLHIITVYVEHLPTRDS